MLLSTIYQKHTNTSRIRIGHFSINITMKGSDLKMQTEFVEKMALHFQYHCQVNEFI